MKLQEFFTRLDEGLYDPHIFKCIFVFGAPASGKSTFQRYVLNHTGLRLIDSDSFYDKLVSTHTNVSDLYKRAFAINNNRLNYLMNQRMGLMFSSTGRKVDQIEKTKDMLNDLGYECMGVFIDKTLDNSLRDNTERMNTQKRTVDPDWLKSSYEEVYNNLTHFENIFKSNFVRVDNNENEGHKDHSAIKRINRFLNTPVRNPYEHYWRQQQMISKNKYAA